jgi:hypothetical protein
MRSPAARAFLALVFLFLNIVGCVSEDVSDFEWVVAQWGEGQAEACHRVGFQPASTARLNLPWTPSALSQVASQLNLTVLNSYNSSSASDDGVRGCCAPGMWCGPSGCFTQSFGRFSNYGPLSGDTGDNASLPVYSCTGLYSNLTTGGVQLADADLRNGYMTLYGEQFSSDPSENAVSIYGETCGEVESCNCLTCDGGM